MPPHGVKRSGGATGRVAAIALLSAALFGASTPVAKGLLGSVTPNLLAAFLYCGCGVGLLPIWLGMRARSRRDLPRGREWTWVALGFGAGGVVAPLLLMHGLSGTPAGTAALLLTLDGIFTTLLARLLFGESVSARVWIATLAMLVATSVLAYDARARFGISPSAALIILACAMWAVDNNATRRVSASDALFLAMIKGLASGVVVAALAAAAGAALPPPRSAALSMAVGFFGYGISLVLYILALRHIGSARASTYFATAPFFGGAIAVVYLHEPVTARLVIAGALMALGVALVASEGAGEPPRPESS